MIKQIQLRGISRTPSDRMNEDGGVAESLNTYIAEGESAPALPPEDMAAKLGLPTKNSYGQVSNIYKCVYIHRVGNEDHFIYVKRKESHTSSSSGYSYEGLYSYPGGQEVYTADDGVDILDDTVTSIGNTLVFSTTEGNGYAVYKNGEYIYLGSELPQPQLAVYPNLYGGNAKLDCRVTVYPWTTGVRPSEHADYKNTDIGELLEAGSTLWKSLLDGSEVSSDVKKIVSDFWAGLQGRLLNSQYFRYPVAVRFALKLYDGTYVHHTVPILLGGGAKRYFNATMIHSARMKTSRTSVSSTSGGASGTGSTGTDVLQYTTYFKVSQQKLAYKIFSKLANESDFDGWSDVIQSIDMFISAPILYPKINSQIVEVDDTEKDVYQSGIYDYYMGIRFQDPAGSVEESESYLNSLLDGTRLFYKVRSFPLDSLQELSEGYEQKNTKQLSYTENLYTHEALPDDYRSNNNYTSEKNYAINRRLISLGVTETFGRGMESLYGLNHLSVISTSNPETHESYRFFYEIRDTDGTLKSVYSRTSMSTPSLSHRAVGSSGVSDTVSYFNSDLAQLIFYPDTRCQGVYVINSAGAAVYLEMKPHPYLNCAYYLGDPAKTLGDLAFGSAHVSGPENRKGSAYYYSYLFQSALENPFYYPASGRIKFSASLVAVASITTALSEGQYGQFDLYAFTDNGIWVLTPNDEGVYTRLNPLSRDVCISSSAVACLDQAVVFITKRGVMLLGGSKITCLSPNMNGEHYVMEDAAVTVLDKVDPDVGYDYALTSGVPFMKFMTDNVEGGTQIAYDNAGSRLIFFNRNYDYQYIYMLQTGTWHKYIMDAQRNGMGVFQEKILNSYPDCYMFCNENDGTLHLFNWSTVLDVSDKTTEIASVIATRPFDLGEADILKTINHLKIRGHYERYRTLADGTKKPRVSYMLFGSQDGFNFYRLGSLRGKSWKLFRIIILSYLRPTERISYIDIEYETRFTNKLR